MDPHCEEVGDTHGGCKENEGGECCTNDSKCAESGDCQECSMEELEKWACSKEGTKIIQQYVSDRRFTGIYLSHYVSPSGK